MSRSRVFVHCRSNKPLRYYPRYLPIISLLLTRKCRVGPSGAKVRRREPIYDRTLLAIVPKQISRATCRLLSVHTSIKCSLGPPLTARVVPAIQ